MSEIYDVIILGTGISGLTAAIYLKEAGLKVIAITKTDKPQKQMTKPSRIIFFLPLISLNLPLHGIGIKLKKVLSVIVIPKSQSDI